MQMRVVKEYLSWFVDQYHQFQQSTVHANIYKIRRKEVDVKTQEEVLFVQLAGKSIFFKLNPREIVADDAMLNGFSAADVRTITYLACKKHFQAKQRSQMQPKGLLYKIVTQAFSRRQKKQMLVIEQTEYPELITASAQSLSNDPEMIAGFSPTDAHKIGCHRDGV